VAARVVSLPGFIPDKSANVTCPQLAVGSVLRQDFEDILREPVPARISLLIGKLREQETPPAASIVSEHCHDKS
jgi:hypothetical protein